MNNAVLTFLMDNLYGISKGHVPVFIKISAIITD